MCTGTLLKRGACVRACASADGNGSLSDGGSGGAPRGGPAPYEILAARKRKAAKANEEAFRAALAARGLAAPADLSSQYAASKLVSDLAGSVDSIRFNSTSFCFHSFATRGAKAAFAEVYMCIYTWIIQSVVS